MDDLARLLRAVGRADGLHDPRVADALAAPPASVTGVAADEHARALVLAVTGVTERDLLAACGPRSEAGGLPLPDGTFRWLQAHRRGAVAFGGYRAAPGAAVDTVVAAWPGAGGGPELHAATGTLRIAGRVVGPATTRLAADTYRIAGAASWTDTGNDHATLHVEDGGWLAGLAFAGEHLALVTLYAKEPVVPTWDEAAEQRRHATHDALVGDAHGAHAWGEVWSGYDERAGVSEIRVRFGPGTSG